MWTSRRQVGSTSGELGHAERLQQWRMAAQRVAGAWSAWLAADASERDWAHEAYLNALAREEEAAGLLEHEARALHERAP
jgi:hypothetical protein